MKKVLYIGRFFTPNILKWVSEDSNGNIGFSNHNFEMSMVNGLTKHKEIDLHIITLPSVYSYPNNSKTFYVKEECYNIDDVSIQSVGFCNLLLLNKFTSILSLFMAILRYHKSNKMVEDTYVIVNTPKLNLLVSVLLSRLFVSKRMFITLVIPDIPSMITRFNGGNSFKKKIQQFIDSLTMRLSAKCDNFVLLTEEMKDFFRKRINYTIVEGLIDVNHNEEYTHEKLNGKSIILYTGTLNKFFGITKLLDAFDMLGRNDTELWICGSGDSRREIEIRCQKNPNIKFLGLVDVEKARKLQMQADILINPRGAEGEFTKYSFPSKTIEYLKTGNVVIINKLPGIPLEYYKYVYTPADESVEALRDTINSVLDMPEEERMAFGQKAREFVLKKKNSYIQVGKILDMMFNDKLNL